MLGQYRISEGSKLYVCHNVLTTAGKREILNVIAGKRIGLAQSIGVGISSTAAIENDESLEFQVGSATISVSLVNYDDETIIFKGTLPENDQYYIYELGAYAPAAQITSGSQTSDSNIFFLFNSQTRWNDVDGTYVLDGTNTRLGDQSISYDNFAAVEGYSVVEYDFSGLAVNTEFRLAYYANAVSSLEIRLETDDTNYYSYTPTAGNGYQIDEWLKSDFTATGSPAWADINALRIISAGTSADLSLDAMRYDIPKEESQLISRAVLGTPIRKAPGVKMDIEWLLDLDI